MGEPPDLDALYEEARSAITARETQRAADLLKRILISDENYKDASRLLAQVVAQGRRRWYRDWRIGAAILVVGLSLWLWRAVPWTSLRRPPATSADVASPTHAIAPAAATVPTDTAAPGDAAVPAPPTLEASSHIPLRWIRLSTGLRFARDAITVIVADPTDPDLLYVGTKHAGVYKSIDGGLSWRPVHIGLEAASVATMAIDPVNTRNLYAGTLLGGVYATSDGGDLWESLNQGLRTPTEWSNETSTVTVDPHDSNHIYYLDPTHIYETSAGTDRWQLVVDGENTGEQSPCDPHDSDMAVHPLQPRTLLVIEGGNAGCPPGIYTVDTDSGTRTLLFGTDPSGHLWDLKIDGLSGRHLYVTGSDEKGGLVYSSSDGGETWLMNRIQNGAWPCRSIAVSATNGEIAYCASGGGLYRTTDAGTTWRAAAMWPYQEAEQYVTVDDRRIFLAKEGLSVSLDGGASWEPRRDGLGATFLQLNLRPNHANELYLEEGSCIVGTKHDTNLYVSHDGGVTWSLEADRGCGAAFSLDSRLIYRTGISNSEVLQSEGGGALWTATPLSATGLLPVYLGIIPPDLGTLFVAFHDYRLGAAPDMSYDDGVTWVSTRLREGRLVLAYDGQGEAIYALSNEGTAYRSTTNGTTWSACETSLGFRPSEISTQAALVHAGDNQHVLVGTRGGGVIVSRDGCRSWGPSNSGLDSLFVNALALDPSDPDIVYAGTDGGAYVSLDGGETWGEINDGLLGATVVYSIVVDPQSNVYAATPYGVFRLEGR